MATINLLPWREVQREERKREFFILLGVGAGTAALILLIVHLVFAGFISAQKSRNRLLKSEIKVLDKKIASIDKLKKEKDALIARMNIIQELQTSRPLSVKLFDTIVDVMPNGVILLKVERKSENMVVEGEAESNTQVSELMRRIEQSIWLYKPKLSEIKQAGKLRRFVMIMKIRRPKLMDKSS